MSHTKYYTNPTVSGFHSLKINHSLVNTSARTTTKQLAVITCYCSKALLSALTIWRHDCIKRCMTLFCFEQNDFMLCMNGAHGPLQQILYPPSPPPPPPPPPTPHHHHNHHHHSYASNLLSELNSCIFFLPFLSWRSSDHYTS